MSEWRRDPDEIRAMSRQFDGVGELLSQMSQDVTNYSNALGSQNVINAYSTIANNWWVERGKLVAELKSAASSLLQIASEYERDEVANGASRS